MNKPLSTHSIPQAESQPTFDTIADPSMPARFGRLDLALLVLLILLAGALRLPSLETLPPGLHHDEAVNGLDVLFNIDPAQGKLPVFFEMNNGREGLFIYLQYLSAELLGPSIFSLRVVSALIGISTVALTWLLARRFLPPLGAALAGFGLATSFWHVDLSRIGLRAISAPLFLLLIVLFLHLGLSQPKERHSRATIFLSLSGLFLGLSLYTYLSARVFAPIVVAILIYEGIRNPGIIRDRWAGLLAALLIAVAVALPLGLFFAQNPDYFIGRSGQVSIFNPNPTIEGNPDSFGHNLSRNLGMFFDHGDDNARHNLPGKPVFTPFEAPFFLIGLVLAVIVASRGLFRRPRDGNRGSDPSEGRPLVLGWLLIWAGATFALGVLTHESPNYLRLTALAPAVYLLWGYGLDAAIRWAGRIFTRRFALPAKSLKLVGALVLALIVSVQTVSLYRDYFVTWAGSVAVYRAFDGGVTAIARHVQAIPEGDRTPLVLYVDRSPAVLFLAQRSRSARWLQEYSNLLLLPPETKEKDADGVEYIYFGDGKASESDLFFAGMKPTASVLDPVGATAFTAYRLTADELRTLREGANQTPVGPGAGTASLLAFSVEPTVLTPGQPTMLTLLWEEKTDGEKVYAPYIHIRDAAGRLWGQDDKLAFAVGGWKAGDQFLSRHAWTPSPDSPPIEYRIEAGLAVRPFGWPPGPPETQGTPQTLARTTLVRSAQPVPAAAPAIARRLDLTVLPGLSLVGTSNPPAALRPGDELKIDLLWQSSATIKGDLIFELALLPVGQDQSQRPIAAESARPAYGQYPTFDWTSGYLLDPRSMRVPGGANTGQYRIRLRAIDAESNASLFEGSIAEIRVEAPERSFALPDSGTKTDIRFGGKIALRGFEYSPDSLRVGDTLRLKLFWQALAPMETNYTVFTHLLATDSATGSPKVTAQMDAEPQRGNAPTSGWLEGQVIVDEYELKLSEPLPGGVSPEELAIEVGLYDAKTGKRLDITERAEDYTILGKVPVRASGGGGG